MHLILFMPILANGMAAPSAAAFIILLSIAALLRSRQ